ncbi:MAG: hypothetical protein MHPSP_001413, partial [Paramarteilia canceri]
NFENNSKCQTDNANEIITLRSKLKILESSFTDVENPNALQRVQQKLYKLVNLYNNLSLEHEKAKKELSLVRETQNQSLFLQKYKKEAESHSNTKAKLIEAIQKYQKLKEILTNLKKNQLSELDAMSYNNLESGNPSSKANVENEFDTIYKSFNDIDTTNIDPKALKFIRKEIN